MMRARGLTRIPALRSGIRFQATEVEAEVVKPVVAAVPRKAKPVVAAAPKPVAAAPKPVVAAPKPVPVAVAVAAAIKQVKFVKEDVNDVMSELPHFNFYEIKEPVENAYKGATMDYSVLFENREGSLPPAGKVEYSVLENGLRVASIDRAGLSASLGLHVSAGSRFEDASNFGVSHMTSLMAFKSTAHLSNLRTMKVLEQLGCQYTAKCEAGREDIVYSVNVMREFVPLVVPLLIGNVLFPRLLPWEVKSAHPDVAVARNGVAADPDASVNELLHKTAYFNNTLGRSPIASERDLGHFTPDAVRNYMLDHFAPERMVLTGVNVPHDELAKWAMRSFVDYNAIPLKERAVSKATYTGGFISAEGDSPFCHLAVGLESPGLGKDVGAVSVLRALLGQGSALEKAPGSGITSRLGQFASQNGAVESVSAFNTTFSDSGLFGVYAVCEPAAAASVATDLTKALASLKNASADELNKAKAQLKVQFLRQIDDTEVLRNDIGTQTLLFGKYATPAEFCATIDAVTASQVSAVANSILASKPTVVAFGDTHAVPHYSTFEAGLK